MAARMHHLKNRQDTQKCSTFSFIRLLFTSMCLQTGLQTGLPIPAVSAPMTPQPESSKDDIAWFHLCVLGESVAPKDAEGNCPPRVVALPQSPIVIDEAEATKNATASLKLTPGTAWLVEPSVKTHSETVNGVNCLGFEAMGIAKCNTGPYRANASCTDETINVGCNCPSTVIEAKVTVYMPDILAPYCASQHMAWSAVAMQRAGAEFQKYFPCAAKIQAAPTCQYAREKVIAKASLTLGKGHTWISPPKIETFKAQLPSGTECVAFSAIGLSKCYYGIKSVEFACQGAQLEVGCNCPSLVDVKMALYMPPSLASFCAAQHLQWSAETRQKAGVAFQNYFACGTEGQERCLIGQGKVDSKGIGTPRPSVPGLSKLQQSEAPIAPTGYESEMKDAEFLCNKPPHIAGCFNGKEID